MNFFQIVKAAAVMLPVVLETINAVEALFPQGGLGQQKLAMVKAMLMAANEKTQQVADFEAIWPILAQAIAGIVATQKVVKK